MVSEWPSVGNQGTDHSITNPRRTAQEAACERLVERLVERLDPRDRRRPATRPQDVGGQRALANLEQRYRADCR